ncbi:UDP-galactopyranose mutase [Nibribacter koreensis]|uniref:UDP-galactopyranose mutase n=1 Tax=Nibribacter koreensis TaxID=1084519 RepID=A0ABP8F4T9_9BACT
MKNYDFIIVGSGFAGSIMAERFANVLNKKVLIIEQRDHIAGNMFDYYDEAGVLIHKYGPHLFRTNEDFVWDYMSQFTEWHPYQHKVVAEIDTHLVPVPFNLTSLEVLMPEKASEIKEILLSEFGMDKKVPVSVLRKHQNPMISELGSFIFEKIYLNYTTKQWGEKPENLDFETITARVPVHVSYDDRYFQEKYQFLPKEGYTQMFKKMLSNPNIEVRLSVKANEVLNLDTDSNKIFFKGEEFTGTVIYSGAIDEMLGYAFGELPYRSLRFEVETHDKEYFQPTGTVNYPNDHDYTRISEYKHMMAQKPSKTSVMVEYPQEYKRLVPGQDIPYYPIPKDENTIAYDKYRSIADKFSNLYLIGRLAEYKYYDMNNIIMHALKTFNEEFANKN